MMKKFVLWSVFFSCLLQLQTTEVEGYHRGYGVGGYHRGYGGYRGMNNYWPLLMNGGLGVQNNNLGLMMAMMNSGAMGGGMNHYWPLLMGGGQNNNPMLHAMAIMGRGGVMNNMLGMNVANAVMGGGSVKLKSSWGPFTAPAQAAMAASAARLNSGG
jgi:hypothetical protein